MKRVSASGNSENDICNIPLKKRASSLFSIATFQERGSHGGDNQREASSDESVGLDLIEKEAIPAIIKKQKNEGVPPPPLSYTEDSSCGDEDDQSHDTTCLSTSGTRAIPVSKGGNDVNMKELSLPVTIAEEVSTINSTGLKTGIVFEEGAKHFDRHNRFHKERPIRISSIIQALKASEDGEWTRCHILGEETTSDLATKFLDDDDYLSVHLPGYMKRLDKIFNCNCCSDERLDLEAEQFKSIYFTKDSLNEAKTAASSLCSLVENVIEGKLDNGFAVIRPPGHHAEPGLAGGYCIINNVAVAAAFARKKLGVEKVMIVDWDVHHGNGTQSIFLKDPNVLYFSAHRWHGGNFFPFLSNGGPTSAGIGEGAGFNINVGWTVKGVADEEYLAVWNKLLLPVAREFQPGLILVSAGFDAAEGDMGECNVTPECYGILTRKLMTLNVPIVCALEGGYVRSVLGKCVRSVVSALLDKTSHVEAEGNSDEYSLDCINSTAAKNIKATIAVHEPFWKCLRA